MPESIVQVRVIDTSSLILMKEMPKVARGRILRELDALADQDRLFFPPEVLDELGRYTDPKGPDLPLTWARGNEEKAARYGRLFQGAKEVLAKAPLLIDAEKVALQGYEDADPYVVALAIHLRNAAKEVTVITDDFHTIPGKTSLSDAAGLFGLPTLTFRTFLIYDQGIWDGEEGT